MTRVNTHVRFQLPGLAALARAEANGFMGMQHAVQYGQLPPDFANANALGVNIAAALDSSQRHPQEQLAHHLDGRASHAGQSNCKFIDTKLGHLMPPLQRRQQLPCNRLSPGSSKDTCLNMRQPADARNACRRSLVTSTCQETYLEQQTALAALLCKRAGLRPFLIICRCGWTCRNESGIQQYKGHMLIRRLCLLIEVEAYTH